MDSIDLKEVREFISSRVDKIDSLVRIDKESNKSIIVKYKSKMYDRFAIAFKKDDKIDVYFFDATFDTGLHVFDVKYDTRKDKYVVFCDNKYGVYKIFISLNDLLNEELYYQNYNYEFIPNRYYKED